MEDFELKKLQTLELLLALEVKRICQNNNIPYFIIAGSMLGAVRHKGFIPWDDDMDIGFLRPDYDKFISACKTQLGDQFFLQTWDTDSTYPYPYGKLRLKGTQVADKMTKNVNTEKGFFIDLFPFDKICDDANTQSKLFKKLNFYKKILWIKKGYGVDILNDGLVPRLKYRCAQLIALAFDYKSTKEKLIKIQTQYNNGAYEKVYFLTVYDYKKSVYDIELVQNLKEYEFESESFSGIADYDTYLKIIYNKYMVLPPEEKRHDHQISILSFGQY